MVTKRLITLLKNNPYDIDVRRKIYEIGDEEDLIFLLEIDPYDFEAKQKILERGNDEALMLLLAKNRNDFEARQKILERGGEEALIFLLNLNPLDFEAKKKLLDFEERTKNVKNESEYNAKNMITKIKEFDVFICHASEDKNSYVKPLANALSEAGIKVWYDDFVLEWGDSIRASIDRGLANSRYGIVIFSKAFLDKNKTWTKHELDGLFAKEVDGKKVILPIWHDITRDELLKYSPSFAIRMAKDTKKDTIEDIVKEVKKLLGK